MSESNVATDEAGGSGPCKLRGLGHPRAFDAATKASRPTFARVGQNLFSGWVASTGANQQAVFTTRLDYALRRIAPERVVTPEVTDARDPQLFGTENGLLLLYTDARGKESLIFGRELDGEGRDASPPRLLNGSESDFAYDPTMTRAPDGSYWVAYTQAEDKRVHDLFLRPLDRALSPIGPPARITAYAPPEKLRSVPSFAITRRQLDCTLQAIRPRIATQVAATATVTIRSEFMDASFVPPPYARASAGT